MDNMDNMDNIKFTIEDIEILCNYGLETSRQYILSAEDGIKVAVVVPSRENRSKQELISGLREAALFNYKTALEEKRKREIVESQRVHVGDVI